MPNKDIVQLPSQDANYRGDNPLQSYNYVESKSSPKREYFSGANVKVYFGDVWLDQLVNISFSMQEQVAPIYGFNSYTFDRISRGSRMVQGQFTINFTENGYMQSILKRAGDSMQSVTRQIASEEPNNYMQDIDEYKTIKDLLTINSKETYMEQVNALKASLWGVDTGTDSAPPYKENDTYFYTTPNAGKNELRVHGFNILIDYSPDANMKDFQDCLDDIKQNKSSFQTYRTIIGVHIGSESQSVVNNGQAIQQTYQFVAKDLDGDTSTPSMIHKGR